MTAIEALNLPLEPEPIASPEELRQCELGQLQPTSPEDVHRLVLAMREAAGPKLGQVSLALV